MPDLSHLKPKISSTDEWVAKFYALVDRLGLTIDQVNSLIEAAETGNPWTPPPNTLLDQIPAIQEALTTKRSKLFWDATDFALYRDSNNPPEMRTNASGQPQVILKNGQIQPFGLGIFKLTPGKKVLFKLRGWADTSSTDSPKITVKFIEWTTTVIDTKVNYAKPTGSGVVINAMDAAKNTGTSGRFEILINNNGDAVNGIALTSVEVIYVD